VRAANNQPAVIMVDHDYHEEDGQSTTSSTTQIPTQHPLSHRYRERHSGSVDLSTVPPTPLSNCRHLLSPVRMETPSNSYNLCSTPDRISALGHREESQGNGLGRAVAGGAVAGSGVLGGGVPVSGGGVARSGVIGGGAAGSGGGVAGTGVIEGGVAVAAGGQQRERGGRGSQMRRGVAGRGLSGGRRSRQSTGATAGGLAWGGVKNYTPAKVESLLQTIKAICTFGNEHWQLVAQLHSNHYAVCGRTAESIKRKFSSLASTQHSSGNLTMPHSVSLAKEIHEAISLSDFFDDGD